MRETKEFPTRDVLSTITGKLIGEMGGIYEVLGWMTGESVITHQLPRIGREARPVILAMRPQLQSAIDEAANIDRENWREWRDTWEKRFGATIAVPKFGDGEHVEIGAMTELMGLIEKRTER